MSLRTFVSSLFLLLMFASHGWADIDESRAQLEKVKKRIENARIDLKQKKKSEVRFSRELAVLNRTLQRLDSRIAALKKEQRQLQTRAEKQKKQVDKDKQQIRTASRRLEKRLVALYKEGEIGPLKILFSADSPTELVQQYHYLTRVVQHDQVLLEDYRRAVETHQQGLAELERLNNQKQAVIEDEQQQRKVAADGRRLQAQLLKQVKQEKRQLAQELAELEERAKRLQGLVSRLQRDQETEEPEVVKPGAVQLSANKGKLVWPVNGPVLINFGTQKDKSLGTYYESNGIEVGVAPGTSIRAVADGKVVFADWFKGYGNLMILSHSGGFHTLYAQAEELSRAVGDQVAAGTVLGKSGLAGRDSVYFEIRQNGSPVNPLKWLKRR